MKICVVRLSALGDIVMMLPLIRTLQLQYPKAEITWIVGKSFAGILWNLEGIRIVPISKVRSIKEYFALRKELSSESYDILLGCQASMSAHLIFSMIRAKRKIGYDALRGKDFHKWFVKERIPFKKQHTLDGFLEFARVLGVTEFSYDGRVPLAMKERVWASLQLGEEPYCVINPCTSREEKDWSKKKFQELISHIEKNMGLRVVLTGGAKDAEFCKDLGANIVDLVGKTSLLEMAAVIERAEFMVAPDTGPIHIASGLKTPVIGLYAASDKRLTGPYFHLDLVVDRFFEAYAKIKGKADPDRVWNERIREKGSLELITVKDVVDALSRITYRSLCGSP